MNRKERRRFAKQTSQAASQSRRDPSRAFAEAHARHQAGDLAGAQRGYQEILASNPNHVGSLCMIGVLHQSAGRNREAAAAYQKVIALAPDHDRAHLGLGVVLRGLGDHEAIGVLRRAVQLRPDDPDAHVNLANALQEHGEPDLAREAVASLLATHPAHVTAWAIHSGLKTFAEGDPDLDRMEALLADLTGAGGSDSDAEIILAFALGKAWMDVGDVDRAFSHLARANRLKRATFDYDVGIEVQRLARIPGGVKALSQSSTGPGDPSELPIFVVGMPRSGSTLVEQILASHADVAGGGELTAFQEAMAVAFAGQRAGRAGSPFDPAILGRAYLERVAPLAAGKARLVDKMPANFQNVGLISLALPNARVIHCRRDPVATGLSCFATRFVGHQPFAYDLVELGRYYRGCAALMDHWRATLPPERFLDVDYEDVLADVEGVAQRLIAFCGLPWDPNCLRFHESRRPVRTASVNQVRQPLYAASLGRWRGYARHLRPLIEALQEAR